MFAALICCFLLFTSQETNSEDFDNPTIYFLHGGVKKNTTDLKSFFGLSNVKTSTVDLSTIQAILTLQVVFGDGSATTSSRHYVDGSAKVKPCTLKRKFTKNAIVTLLYECNPTRFIIFDGFVKSFTISSIKTYLERYIGCFAVKSLRGGHEASHVDECESFCPKTPFFGINLSSKCHCITSLTELVPVEIELCNEACWGTYTHQICGAYNYFAVYSKRIFQKNQYFSSPKWDCITKDRLCRCPEGRQGVNCELIDCSTNNGYCGELECRRMSFKESFYQICSCVTGFYLDDEFNCNDIDECWKSPCIDNSFCVNLVGNFTCYCIHGFSLVDDVCVEMPTEATESSENVTIFSSTATYKEKRKSIDFKKFTFAFLFASLPLVAFSLYALCKKRLRGSSFGSSQSSSLNTSLKA